MKVARLVGLAFVAILAIGALAASTALASSPEFKVLPTGSKAFTSTSGVSVLTAASQTIECEKDTTNGEITGMDSVGKVLVTYTGCVGAAAGCTTKVNSSTGKTGEIVTNPIKGTIGTVKTSEAASGVGILFEPEAGTKFVTFAKSANGCIVEATTNGDVAGEVTPINKLQSTNKIVLLGITGHKQKIAEITVLGKVVKPILEAFGGVSSEASTDLVTYSGPVEVS